jgi:hypothetical protein
MNMEVNKVIKSAAGFSRKRLGTNAHFVMKASPPLSSTKKKSRFSAISTCVTMGTVLTELLSSPIGMRNMNAQDTKLIPIYLVV